MWSNMYSECRITNKVLVHERCAPSHTSKAIAVRHTLLACCDSLWQIQVNITVDAFTAATARNKYHAKFRILNSTGKVATAMHCNLKAARRRASLLPFETRALQKRLRSKIKAKFCTFWPLVKIRGEVGSLSEFYELGLGPNLWLFLTGRLWLSRRLERGCQRRKDRGKT